MTSQSSGGSGSGLPGVTGDGKTPGGEVIAGALAAGDPNAASLPSFITLNGATSAVESPGVQVDGDNVFGIKQIADLVGDSYTKGLWVYRGGALNGFNYQLPLVQYQDGSGATAPLLQLQNTDGTQFQVDGDGVQVHGKFKTGAAVAHTAAVLSGNCVPIYDESGTLLGYMPLYN